MKSLGAISGAMLDKIDECKGVQVIGEGLLKSCKLGDGLTVIIEFKEKDDASVCVPRELNGKRCRLYIEKLG